MSKAALTARYRPQTFAELAGQDILKAILSRAAAEDRIAPAYLFSGTRGVGKTTIARIFAKALNCRNAPTAEPCNNCDQCRAITLGTAVDVLEIDGASNRGIDDVRRLKESVGYAPLDGRYKVFIIDEAHMLSREAFNALLKTLEEPPARVTFILATTEPHKFPVTIVSRCQHYVFKRLSQQELENHLSFVLQREGLGYEAAALHIIARRAAGSVRDGMSLLGQVLALGADNLKEDDVRSVLGLAGQELFVKLLGLVSSGATLEISLLVRAILDQGLDLGFFLRELTATWRNLFMLRQVGLKAVPALDLPEAEAAALLEQASAFELAHIHAAWQMALEGQRKVLTSLEPALALELLLLNMALLPRLLPLEQLGTAQKKSPESVYSQSSPEPVADAPQARPLQNQAQPNIAAIEFAQPVDLQPAALPTEAANAQRCEAANVLPSEAAIGGTVPEAALDVAVLKQAEPERLEPAQAALAGQPAAGPTDWPAFLAYCAARAEVPASLRVVLNAATAVWLGLKLEIVPAEPFAASRLERKDVREELLDWLEAFCGFRPELFILPPAKVYRSRQDILAEAAALPEINLLRECFSANLIECGNED